MIVCGHTNDIVKGKSNRRKIEKFVGFVTFCNKEMPWDKASQGIENYMIYWLPQHMGCVQYNLEQE